MVEHANQELRIAMRGWWWERVPRWRFSLWRPLSNSKRSRSCTDLIFWLAHVATLAPDSKAHNLTHIRRPDRLIVIMQVYEFPPQDFSHFEELVLLLHTLNRRRELVRLVGWARRRKSSGPYAAYQCKLKLEDIRLVNFAARSPVVYAVARAVHRIAYIVFSEPKHMKKGSAAAYRTSIA
jgi:hypothetical protein